jgi:hypothetical protein
VAQVNPVEAQVDAYNARDIESFLGCYSDDVVVEDGAGNTLMRGIDGMRAEYGPFFDEFPNLRAEIVRRIRVGDYFIDEERIHGWQTDPVHAVAIYHVADGKIDHVRLFGG